MWHSVFPSTILEMFMYISCFFSVFCYWISYSISLVKTIILDIKLYLRCLHLPTFTSQRYFCSQILFENTGLNLLPRNSLVSGLPWWRHQMETFPAILPFAKGIRRSHVDSPHKGLWRGALMFFFWCAPEQTLEQTVEMAVIWDAVMLIMTSLQWFLRHSVGVFQDLRLVFLAMINHLPPVCWSTF